MQSLHPVVKKLLIALTVLIIILAVLLGISSQAIKWAAVYWLEQQNMEASIENIRIDFNDAMLEIINAKASNSEGKGFVVGRFHLDLAWQPLLDNQVLIENIELQGFKLDVVQDKQGALAVAGIRMPAGNAADDKPVEKTQATPWRIELANILLADIETCFDSISMSRHFCSSLGKFDWQGKVVMDTGLPAETQPEVAGSLSLDDILLRDQRNNRTLLSNKKISLSNIDVNGINKIKLEAFKLAGLRVLPEKDKEKKSIQLAQLDSLDINKLDLADNKLVIEKIVLTGPGVSIARDQQGELELAQRLSEILPAEDKQSQATSKKTIARKKAATNKDESSMAIKIGELLIRESHPISFTDNSMATPFNLLSEIKLFSLKTIDTANPQQHSQLQLHIITDKHGSIELAGDIQLFAEARSFDINGKITGIDLRPVGAYIETGIGHRIKSGQLNADVKLLSKGGKLDSLLSLDLKHFRLKALSKEEKEKLDEQMGLGIPMDMALNLLRDKDNSIKLKLPITGDVNNPEFDPSDAVYTATSKAMTAAIINYYTPFGLVSAAKGLLNLATALHFDPVEFSAGEVALNKKHHKALDKIVVMMTERPALHVTLCGYSNEQDFKAIKPDAYQQLKDAKAEIKPANDHQVLLHDLAAKRSEGIKAYLVKKGIGADRLVLCEPEFVATGIAGVEISL